MADARPKYLPIDRSEVPEIYRLMDELIEAHHASDLCEARVGLAWVNDVRPDRDGHLVWGKAKKIGELERNYIPFDFLILLNRHVWGELQDPSRRALLDHELTHCGSVTSDAGETTYYVRHHDLEEFVAVVRRYGLWREGVEQFVNAALQKKEPTLFDGDTTSPKGLKDAVQASLQEAGFEVLGVDGRTVTLGKKK